MSFKNKYVPRSIFHLARLLYVRSETFGPYYVEQGRHCAIYCSSRSAETTPCVSEPSCFLKYDIYPDALGAAPALQNFCLIPLFKISQVLQIYCLHLFSVMRSFDVIEPIWHFEFRSAISGLFRSVHCRKLCCFSTDTCHFILFGF
jgi:hypothetical protein